MRKVRESFAFKRNKWNNRKGDKMNNEKRSVIGNGIKVTYTLIHKKVKNVNLHIEKNGQIVVSANPFVPVDKIDQFVLDKIHWILDKQKAVIARQEIFHGTNTQELTYLGNKYKIIYHQSTLMSVKLKSGECFVYAPSEAYISAVLDVFIDKQCKTLFSEVFMLVFNWMKEDYPISCPKLKIRTMSSQWGSCIPSKNQITLNRKCIYYDIKFLEYVVVHEFAHLIQPNHSKQFYYIIEKYLPDYKERIQIAHQ